jgi:hypothetical protein
LPGVIIDEQCVMIGPLSIGTEEALLTLVDPSLASQLTQAFLTDKLSSASVGRQVAEPTWLIGSFRDRNRFLATRMSQAHQQIDFIARTEGQEDLVINFNRVRSNGVLLRGVMLGNDSGSKRFEETLMGKSAVVRVTRPMPSQLLVSALVIDRQRALLMLEFRHPDRWPTQDGSGEGLVIELVSPESCSMLLAMIERFCRESEARLSHRLQQSLR